MLHFPSVAYKDYKVYVKFSNPVKDWEWVSKVAFTYTFKNYHYTTFETDWRYGFTAFALLALFLFLYRSCSANPSNYTVEQAWTRYLLLLLLLFNAPWHGVSLFTKN